MEGVLPSGAPLEGVRFGQVRVSGQQAACVQCHRRSGMGAVEGEALIEPITGNYLFSTPDKSQLAVMDQRVSKSFNLAHPPYDEATLARAVRQGMNVNGRSMHVMMPRFELDDASFQALSAYLHQLTTQWSPGVGAQTVRLATIIAPGVDPKRRQVLLDMLQTAVRQKNANTALGTSAGRRHHMATAAEMVLGTERKWELDVWELQGEPGTWQAQLQAKYDKAPVFAVLSGLSEGTWEPVHAFCETQKLPCWFPIVDAPVVRAGDFYSLYFSRGVLLEADVLASHLLQTKDKSKGPVVQIFRDDHVGRAAAAEFAQQYTGAAAAKVMMKPVPTGDAAALRAALAQLPQDATLVLWLRSADTAALAGVKLATRGEVYFSGQLLSDAADVPAQWRERSRLVYSYELPDHRGQSLVYFYQWLKLRRLPVVDEPMQSKAFFAASYLTDTLVDMLDNLYRDYLIERAENMISRREGSRAEEEAHSSQMMRRAARAQIMSLRRSASAAGASAVHVPSDHAEPMGERQSTTVYPRLTLAPGQRFASKGAQIARFSTAASSALVAQSDWMVP